MPEDGRAVVADTGPLHYLVLVGRINLLQQLFGTVAVPATVIAELRHASAPPEVRTWTGALPSWLAVHPDPSTPAPELLRLDPGERAAIMLAHTLGAGLLLIDDRAGAVAARARGLEAVGTVGPIIRMAAARLLDLPEGVAALRATNFRYPAGMFDALLEEYCP